MELVVREGVDAVKQNPQRGSEQTKGGDGEERYNKLGRRLRQFEVAVGDGVCVVKQNPQRGSEQTKGGDGKEREKICSCEVFLSWQNTLVGKMTKSTIAPQTPRARAPSSTTWRRQVLGSRVLEYRKDVVEISLEEHAGRAR